MGIKKIESIVNRIDNFESVTVIGDPGCDGLGATTLSIFANALTALDTDFTIVAGDIVHNGIHQLYATVSSFVNSISKRPVYMLCGNHDTAYYEDYFGLRDYLLYNDNCLFIILDNSTRKFSENALSVLKLALQEYSRKNIVILFHYPAPNTICTNSVSNSEWQKILSVIEPFKKQIRFIISGHLHSYFEDMTDDIRLIVTGGGGARIEYVNDKIDPLKAHHHVVRLFFDSTGILTYEHISLDSFKYTTELKNQFLREQLEKTLSNESEAHVRYKLFAIDAQEKGYIGLAKMFRAFAESEFYHARNHFYVLNELNTMKNNIDNVYKRECEEVNIVYKENAAFCEKNDFGLSKYVFLDSLEAEKIHQKQLEKAISLNATNSDIPSGNYHVCSSCGYTFTSDEHPKVCPVCGAPYDRIIEVI